MSTEPVAASGGNRLPWTSIPFTLRTAVESRLGGQVVEAINQPGGFSAGVAARLRLAGGGRAFVKAVCSEPNPDTPAMHRSEARVAAALPVGAPVPRLLQSWDDGGWVVLLFEEIDGVLPAQPWRPDELRRVLAAVTELTAQLTPSPIEVPTAAELFGDSLRGWRRLHRDLSEGRDDCADLDPWVRTRLPELARLEARWEDAAAGQTLAHGDLRADNLLLTEHRVVFVDWPWACTSTGWFDLLGMLPSVQLHGGPPCGEVFDSHPVTAGADPDAIDAVLCATVGYLVRQGRKPPPPGLPGIRAFQAAQGRVALDWLRSRPRWR